MKLWKNWPYWKRGVVIGLVLAFIFRFAGVIIIGAFIGWLYGKFKNRNS